MLSIYFYRESDDLDVSHMIESLGPDGILLMEDLKTAVKIGPELYSELTDEPSHCAPLRGGLWCLDRDCSSKVNVACIFFFDEKSGVYILLHALRTRNGIARSDINVALRRQRNFMSWAYG